MSKESSFALITGGSSGIGWAIAQELAAKGFNLLLVSNQPAELENCKAEIETRHGIRCEILNTDLTQSHAAQDVFDYCIKNRLQVEVLVNNAGILVFSEVAEAPTEKVSAILQLHVYTPTMLCRLFAAEMKRKSRGYILNVSSISAVMAYPCISLYGPTKTYIRAFTRALRSEMALYKVSVTCVLPGATATALYDPNRVNIPLAKKMGVMHEATFVAQKAVAAMFNNKAECIPGFINKLTVWVLPCVPRFIINLIHRHTGIVKKGNHSLG